MPLETATYISDLVTSNPAASDPLSNADDHLRLLKATLQATFPYAGSIHSGGGASLPPDGTGANPIYSFYNEPTLGFYRHSASTIAFTGTLLGAVPIGSLIDHGGATAPLGYLACDGQAVSRAAYAQLFAAIGTLWGAGDGSTTFNVPTLVSRFRRHRDNGGLSGAVGNTQSPVIQSHAHSVVGNTGVMSNDHTHGFSGTTSSMNRNASHSHTYIAPAMGAGTGTSPNYFNSSTQSATTSVANTDHEHTFSGTTDGVNSNHSHPISITSGATGDANETRPYSATVLACIRAY